MTLTGPEKEALQSACLCGVFILPRLICAQAKNAEHWKHQRIMQNRIFFTLI